MRKLVIALLLAGCSSSAEAPPGAAASATSATATASPPGAAAAASAAPGASPSASTHWSACKVVGDPESLAVRCGSTRFARRDIVVEIDETKVKAHAGSFYFGSTGSEELAEVREGKLDDGTPAWISTSSGVLKSADDGQQRALVFIGVKRPYGGGVFVSAVGPDAETAMRDANAMWSSPPAAPVPELK